MKINNLKKGEKIMSKDIIQNCKDLYEQFYSIIENKHNAGYKESIVKMFSLVDGEVYVNYYKANCLEIQGTIGKYSIDKTISYDDVHLEFYKLAEEILYYYAKNEGDNSFNSIEEFARSIKDDVYA